MAAERQAREVDLGPEQYLVLVTCRDEKEQVELLGQLQAEGWQCRGVLS